MLNVDMVDHETDEQNAERALRGTTTKQRQMDAQKNQRRNTNSHRSYVLKLRNAQEVGGELAVFKRQKEKEQQKAQQLQYSTGIRRQPLVSI